MSEQASKNEPAKANQNKSAINALKLAAWGIIFFGICAVIFVLYGFFITGDLLDPWNNMSEAQGAVLSSLITVFAAAIAGVVGPAILGSKFNDMEERITSLSGRMENAANNVDNLTLSTKSSLHTLTELLQRNAGISPTYTTDDLVKKDEILTSIQSQAATLAQAALENSGKWASTKDKFRGKWPSRQNYIELLWEYRVITDMDYDGFTQIVKSRELLGEDKSTDPVTLNDLQSTLDKLGEKYGYS